MPRAATKRLRTRKKNPMLLVPGVDSPLPQDAQVITYSELDTFRQCPLKHHWAYDGLWSRESREGSPLARGTLWHEVMETYYHRLVMGDDPNRARAVTAVQHLIDLQTGTQTEDQELVEWMLDGYRECYGNDRHWDILAIEFAGRVPLQEGIYLQFKIDLVIRDRDTNQLWIVDHKSARDFSRQVEIDVDDQFGLYTWALRAAGVPVMGFIRSDARTQRNKGPMALDNRFRRVETFRSEQECENIRRDAVATATAAKSGEYLYSSPAPDRCSWRCDFLQVHLTARKIASDPTQILRDFGFTQRQLRHREYVDNYPQTVIT